MEPFEVLYKKRKYTIIPSNKNKPGRRFYFKILKDDVEVGQLRQQDDENCCWEVSDGLMSANEVDFLSETIQTKYL
ncbi:MAG TPA: hypothetical protein VNI52_09085 [Sphingobacteriaceae bacterium]|nr:hypothetical protein [Sphingobacteriaceae bacterium]